MRKPLIAGNWKMNLDRQRGVELSQAVAAGVKSPDKVDVAYCPPFVYLEAVGAALRGTPVAWGAQDMSYEAAGAFTGEISASMLLDLGCTYVILGHSERRHIFGETDQDVNRKTLAALAAAGPLVPIVCVGELLAEREAGQTATVIRRQFEAAYSGVTEEQALRTVIAYEPVWAIGTGKVATPEQAEEVHLDLRKLLTARYNAGVAERVRILYGGSVKPDNAGSLLGQPNVDGALVGGACLKAEDFLGIIAATLS
ncbi:MAG: triose-phosphate isomerase [Pirellulales bacterium]|nr:triose-phosphate isomerase [Pirellulales bacterium]